MEIVLIVLAGLGLNLSGAVVAKILAAHLQVSWVALGLAVLLALCLAGRVGFWVLVGKRWQLSYIYPFLSINYALAMGLGIVAFDEHLRLCRVVGTAIITMGVWVLSRSEFRREAPPC